MSDTNKITFIPAIEAFQDSLIAPEPAIQHVPGWYKDLALYGTSNDEKNLNPVNNIGTDGTLVATKKCMPFFDALTAGYYYLLEDDLYVDLDKNGFPTLTWKGEVMLIDKRPTMEVAVPDNCHQLHFGFRMNWFYRTPPGHSVLVTHPMNRYDLPFYTLSGIVDSDIWGLPVFFTFFLQKNFQGVIPKGTPIMQFIPFKRENWELEVDNSKKTIEEEEFKAEKRRTRVTGYYKKDVWQRKSFRSKHSKRKKDDDSINL
jgi:hypothetical protein